MKELGFEKTDSIFKPQTDWTMNSCLNFSYDMTHSYVRGFKAMAQMGIEAIKEKRSEQDVLVYPIVFCFRHHIELQLKQAIESGKELLGREYGTPGIHEVDKLWYELRSILNGVRTATGEHPEAKELQNAERVILELAGLDPEGISFRYTVTREGESSIPDELRILNLLSLSEALEKVSHFLGYVGAHLSFLAEQKREIEMEMRKMELY